MKRVQMEDQSKIVCYKRKKRHLKVGGNTQVSVHGPRIVAYCCLSENDPEATSRFSKIQQRSSKMRLRGQMSTIVEESYSMYNAQKNEHHHKQDVRYIKTLKLDTSSCTISNMSTGGNSTDAAATSQDVESLSLGSKGYIQGRSHTAPNMKQADLPSKFRKRRRKRAVKRSLSNSDVCSNYTVCPMQIEFPKIKGSAMSLEKNRHHRRKVRKAPVQTAAEVPDAITERNYKSTTDNVDVEADGEKKLRTLKSRKEKDNDKESRYKEKKHHKHRADSEEVTSNLKEVLKSKEKKEKVKKEKKKKNCDLSKRSSMKLLLEQNDSSFGNLCLGVIKKATITRSELGSLEIPAFKKKADNENKGLMIYTASKKQIVPSSDLIIHPNLIFAGIVHKDTSFTSTNSLFGSSRHSILQSSWMSTYDSSYISWPTQSDSFYDLNRNSLALLSELSSTSGIQDIKTEEQCHFTIDYLQRALNEINQPTVKEILESLYNKPTFNFEEFCNPYCYVSLKDENSNLNRGTNTDISWTNFFQTTLNDRKEIRSKIPKFKREKSECSEVSTSNAKNRSRIPRRIDPTYRTITCATLAQKTVPEEKLTGAFEKYMSTASREVVNLEEEMFEFTFSEPSASDVEKTNKPDTIMKTETETVLVNFSENKVDAKKSNVSIISIKENVVVTKKAKVRESSHSVSIQVYVPPQQVDAVTSISSVDTKSRSKLPIPVASIKSKQSMPSHTIPIEIDLKRASEGNVKADQVATYSCDNGQNVKKVRRLFSRKKRKSRSRLAVTEFQNLFSFYDAELVSLPISAISMFPSFKSVFVEDSTFEIESISFIGIDTNEIIMRALEFAQPLHPQLTEDISAGKVKVENDDNVPLNLPVTTTQTGLSYFTFKSILRKYLANRDTLQMLTPIVRGHMQKAPKVDSALLVDPVPVLEKISSMEFKPEEQTGPKQGIIIPDYLEQGFDDREMVLEEFPEQEREIRNLVKNKEYIYEILHDISESESEKSSEKSSAKSKGSCSCMPCLCSKDTDFLIEYQRMLDQQKEKDDVVNSVLDDLLKKIYNDVDAATRKIVSDILNNVFDEPYDRGPGAKRGVSFAGKIGEPPVMARSKPDVEPENKKERTKPVKRCICGGVKEHPGPCDCAKLFNVPAKRKCDLKKFHDRTMHLSKEFLTKHKATKENVDSTLHKTQTSFQMQIQPKKEKLKNNIEMERRYIKNDMSHDSCMVYSDQYEKTPPILWTLARRFLWKKQPENNIRYSTRRRHNFSKKLNSTSSSASSSKRIFTTALLHGATSFDRKELMNFAPKCKKRKIEEVTKNIKQPIKNNKVIKHTPSIPITILKKPPFGPAKTPEKIPIKNNLFTILRKPPPKSASTKKDETFVKTKKLITLVPPKQSVLKVKQKYVWTAPKTRTLVGTTKQDPNCISTSTTKSEPTIPLKNISDDYQKIGFGARGKPITKSMPKKVNTNDASKIVYVAREKNIVERVPMKADIVPIKAFIGKEKNIEQIPKTIQVIKDVKPPKHLNNIVIDQEVVKFPRIGHQKYFKDTGSLTTNLDQKYFKDTGSLTTNLEMNFIGPGLQTAKASKSKTTTIGISTTYSLKTDSVCQTVTPPTFRQITPQNESVALKKRLNRIAKIDESNKENKTIEIPSHKGNTAANEKNMCQTRVKPVKLNIATSKDYSTKCERKCSKIAEAQTKLTYKNVIKTHSKSRSPSVSSQILPKNQTSLSIGHEHSVAQSAAGVKEGFKPKHHKNKANEFEDVNNLANTGKNKVMKNKEKSSTKNHHTVASKSLGETRGTESPSKSKENTDLKLKQSKEDIKQEVSIKKSVLAEEKICKNKEKPLSKNEESIVSKQNESKGEKTLIGSGKEPTTDCKLFKNTEKPSKRSKDSNSSKSRRKNKENLESIQQKSLNENIRVDSKSKESREDAKLATSRKNKENLESTEQKSLNENIRVDSKSKESKEDTKLAPSSTEPPARIKTNTVDTQKSENYSKLNSRSKLELLKEVTPEVTRYSKSVKKPQKSHKLNYYDEEKQINAVQLQEPLFLQRTEASSTLQLELQTREKNVKLESKQNLTSGESKSKPGLEDFGISPVESHTKKVADDVEAITRDNSSRIELRKVISRKSSLRLNISLIFDEVSKSLCSKNVDSKITERKSISGLDLKNSFEKDMILAMSEIWKKAIKSKSQLSTASKAALIDEMALIFDQLQGKSLQNLKVDSANLPVLQPKKTHKKHRSTLKKHASSNKKSSENPLKRLEEIPFLENRTCSITQASLAISEVKKSSSNLTSLDCKPVSDKVRKHKQKRSDKMKIDSINQTCLDKHVGLLLHEIKKKSSNYQLEMGKTSKHALEEIENKQVSRENKPQDSTLSDKSKSRKNVVSVFTMFPSKTICDLSSGKLSYFEDLPLTNKDEAGKILDQLKVDKHINKSQDLFAQSPSSLRKATNIIQFDSLHKAIKNDFDTHSGLQNEKIRTKRKSKKILLNVSSKTKIQSFNFGRTSIEINTKDVNNNKKYTVEHVVTNQRIVNTKNQQATKKSTSSSSDASEHSIVSLFKDIFRSNKSKKSEEASSVAIKLNDDLFVQNFAKSRLSTIVERSEQTHTPTNRRKNKMKGKIFCVPRNEIKSKEKIVYVVPRDNRPTVLSKLGGTVTKFMLSSSKFFSKKPDKSTEILGEEIITKTKEPLLEKHSKPSLRTINSDIPSLVSYEALYENIMSLKGESAREEEKRRQLERATEELEKNMLMTQQHFNVRSAIDTKTNEMKDSFKELLENVQEDIWSRLQEEKPIISFVNCCSPSYENVPKRLDLPKLETSLEEFRETLKKERSGTYRTQSVRDTCGICYYDKARGVLNQKEHLIDEDDTPPISICSEITIPSQEEFTGGDCDLVSLFSDSYELEKLPRTSYRSAEKEYILNAHNYENSNLLASSEFGNILISKPTADSLVSTRTNNDFVKYYIIPQ